jgi:hypothetical protein
MKKKIKYKDCLCGCGEKIHPTQYLKFKWIDLKHKAHWILTSDAGKHQAARALITAKKIIKKEQSKKGKDLKESIKTLSDWKKELQQLVNLIARLIDFGQPCIATKAVKGKMNGGHFHSVGSNPTIRFNLHNIHIQSEHSNSFKGGDTLRYIEGLKKIYGVDYFDFVNELSQIEPLKPTIEEIKEAIKVAKGIVKELKMKECIYDADTRIELRNLYNTKIGFYNRIL